VGEAASGTKGRTDPGSVKVNHPMARKCLRQSGNQAIQLGLHSGKGSMKIGKEPFPLGHTGL
jgi:hypothetical protein